MSFLAPSTGACEMHPIPLKKFRTSRLRDRTADVEASNDTHLFELDISRIAAPNKPVATAVRLVHLVQATGATAHRLIVASQIVEMQHNETIA